MQNSKVQDKIQNDKNKEKQEKEVDVEQDKEETKLKQKVEDLEGQVKRVLADYQNLEKRVAEQRRELILGANKDLLLKILPVLDTLVLASKHSEDKSLQVSIKQFLGVLESEGVKKIEAVGKQFDPNTMEAIGTQEGKEGEVVEETRTGYMIGDKVLRVAQAIVGSPFAKATEGQEGK